MPLGEEATVPAGTGLAALVIAAQPVFSCVRSGVVAAGPEADFCRHPDDPRESLGRVEQGEHWVVQVGRT